MLNTVAYRGFKIIGFFFFLFSTSLHAQESGVTPSVAYDTVNQRYLTVWEEVIGDASVIKGKFLNRSGSDLDSQVYTLTPQRPTEGCFYQNFSRDNSGISEPTNCSRNSNPAVAYNNGTYLLVWEVATEAEFPVSAANQENISVGVFARMLSADTLEATGSLGEEGLLISKVQVAANNAVQCENGNFVCSDSEIQAWGKNTKPHVAPLVSGDGFVTTWQSDKDFIGCANPERRGASSVYARYIDPAFSATANNNPQMVGVFADDSTLEDSCASLDNVDSAVNPRVAFNRVLRDFVVVYERARANGGSTSIGAKRLNVSEREIQVSGGAMTLSTLLSLEEGSLHHPELISFGDLYVLFVEAPDGIRAKLFESEDIKNSGSALLELNASSPKQPAAATNLGIGGRGPTKEGSEERILLTYQQGEAVFAAILDGNFNVIETPTSLSQGIASPAESPWASSDMADFVVSWQGEEPEAKVFSTFVDVSGDVPPPPGEPPTQPQLQSPDNALEMPPVRAYLSWSESVDPEGGSVSYNLYIGEDEIPENPQVTGISDLSYVIGPETESETGLSLNANTNYLWQIEAVDQGGMNSLSSVRTFSTDDSVVAWWRFDSNPNRARACSGGDPTETVCDSSGNNHHGVAMGNPIWIAPGMPDILGGALEFDGVDDYVSVTHSSALNLSTAITIEVLAEPSSSGGVLMALDEAGNASAGNYQLASNPMTGALVFSFYHGVVPEPNRTYLVATTPFTTGSRGLMALRHTYGNGNSTEIRVDNEMQSGLWDTGTGDELPITVANPLGIMAKSIDLGGANFNSSTVEEVVLYDKYLEDAELLNSFLSRP